MKRIIVLALLLLAFGLVQANAQEFSAGDCPFNNISSYVIECGFVTVPADHAVPDGATIQLAVAIIRSNNPDKAAEPVLYLEGGPGGAPVKDAPIISLQYPFLGVALQNHDVILVDQRGMGLSQPSFYCSPFRSIEDAFTSDYLGLFMERMPVCLDEFEAQGIDWRWFTTEQNALDLAMVGEALGYEKVNLQGTSYGTLLGLIILRERPEVVRSAILDSVLIPAAYTFEESALAYDESFAQMEAYCQADFSCNLAYPNLRQRFVATFERLAENPDSIEVNGRIVPVTAAFFAERLRYMLASVETARLVPAFIVGVENRDYDVVREFVEMVLSVDVTQLPNQALYMTMVCPQAVSDFADDGSPFRAGSFPAINRTMCGVWGEILPFDRTMPVTDVPVLLLSGEFDPLTPPAWSAIAAEGLSHSQRVVVPNMSHEVLQSSCGQRMALGFLQNPEAPVDTSCISEVPAITFILHTTVTRFPVFIAAALLSIAAVLGIGQMLYHGLRGIKRTAWWASFRKMGWVPLVALLTLLVLVGVNVNILPHGIMRLGIVQTMLSLFVALQVTAAFNPSDEPSLEIQLAAPRSIIWMLAERILVIFMVYSLIAFAGIALTLWLGLETNLPVLLIGWLPSSLFLSGLGIYVTVRSRTMALGVLLIGFLWFMFALLAPMFLPGQNFPAPFHLIQPFIWPLHVHASLSDFSLQDYWINRLFLSVAGIGFMLLSAYNLRDSEELLMGVKAKKSSAKKNESFEKTEALSRLSLQAVAVGIEPLSQMLGIAWYEFLMRWRTMGIKVYLLVPIALMVVFTYFMDAQAVTGTTLNPELYDAGFTAYANGKLLGAILCMILFVPVFYLYPVLVANSFPQDKHLGVEELMNASPIAYSTQLIGRILGNVLASWAALFIAVFVVALMWFNRFGAFTLEPLIDLTLGAGLFCSVTTAMTILLGASQSTSRRAVFLAIGFLFLTEFFQMFEIVRFFFPTRSIFVVVYFRNMAQAASGIIEPHPFGLFNPDLLNVLAANSFSLLLIALGVWAWKRIRK